MRVLVFLVFCWRTRTQLFLVLAVMAVANILKSSLGPVGLDKMLVDDIGVGGGTSAFLTRPNRMSRFPTTVQPFYLC